VPPPPQAKACGYKCWMASFLHYGGYPYDYGYGYSSPDYGTVYSDAPNSPQYSYYPSDSSNYQPAFSQQLNNPNDAGFVVNLPDPNAEVWFQNYKTQQRGVVRHYESGQLAPNQNYTFTVRARWNQNGQMMDQTRQVNAQAGQNVTVDFNQPQHETIPTQPHQQPISQ
jgi:uncharacterized protein (TIGR03000 family)